MNRRAAIRCRDCGDELPAGKLDHDRIRLRRYADDPAYIEPDESLAAELRLGARLGWIVLGLVGVGMCLAYPGIGILLAILCLPVLLLRFQSTVGGDGILTWLASSFLLGGVVLLAIGVAFFATCRYLTGGLAP